jgi:hypothetical protein
MWKVQSESGNMIISRRSELKRDASEEDAERIAAATTNKTMREKGEEKN